MSFNRYAARRDANEPELVRLARLLGVLMEKHPPLDWWAFYRGQWIPVEIKNPDGRNRLTDKQVLFLARAKERDAPVWIWRSEDDVYQSLGAVRSA